jgi:hypothetical protein
MLNDVRSYSEVGESGAIWSLGGWFNGISVTLYVKIFEKSRDVVLKNVQL